jgi:hypothetical protein
VGPLGAFSARLRQQVDLDTLTAELLTVGRPDDAADDGVALAPPDGGGVDEGTDRSPP